MKTALNWAYLSFCIIIKGFLPRGKHGGQRMEWKFLKYFQLQQKEQNKNSWSTFPSENYLSIYNSAYNVVFADFCLLLKRPIMIMVDQIMHTTVFPRSSDPFYMVSYYKKWVTTSWTHSTIYSVTLHDPRPLPFWMALAQFMDSLSLYCVPRM